MEIAIGAALGIWFLLSVISQFDHTVVDRMRRHDCFGLIPIWTFFAPNPGQTDYHLIYRDKVRDEQGSWTEVPMVHTRTMWHFLWNPHKRVNKVSSDVVSGIAGVVAHHQELGTPAERIREALVLSLPYLILLSLVTRQDKRGESALSRQFAVAETYGFTKARGPAVLLCSLFHTV